jgi:hypothetical protein
MLPGIDILRRHCDAPVVGFHVVPCRNAIKITTVRETRPQVEYTSARSRSLRQLPASISGRRPAPYEPGLEPKIRVVARR